MSKMTKSDAQMRDMLAQDAAKIIATEGVRDYQRAKNKASSRFAKHYHGALPSNFEIEQALTSFHNTFQPNHTEILFHLQQTALQVLQILNDFSAFLVGPVLEGTANEHSPISIHAYSDTVEDVIETLQNEFGKVAIEERRYTLNKEDIYCPTLTFIQDNSSIEVTVFTLRQKSQVPKSKTLNRSIRRANLKTLTELLSTQKNIVNTNQA